MTLKAHDAVDCRRSRLWYDGVRRTFFRTTAAIDELAMVLVGNNRQRLASLD